MKMRSSELQDVVHQLATAGAVHHLEMAKAEATVMASGEFNSTGPEFEYHKARLESHTTKAECCAKCAKITDPALGKSFLSDDDDDLPVRIEGLSRVARPAPDTLTLVPRTGAPIAKTEVPAAFARLVSVDEDNMEA